MPKPSGPSFLHSLQQRWEQFGRKQQHRRADRERVRRQDEVLKAADGQKAAKQRARFFQNLRRTAAERQAAAQNALRLDTLRENTQSFGGGPGKPKLRRLLSRMVYGVAVLSMLANVVLYVKWSPSRALLTIGKHTVSKREYEADLDLAAGKPVLTRMVVAEVIRQAAARAGVTPTAADIDARIALLRRGGTLPNLPPAELNTAVGQDLALENLRMQGITVSDAEIADEYIKHAARYSLPAQMQATLVVAPNADKTAQAVHLLGTGVSPTGIAAIPGLRVDGINGFALPAGALTPTLRAAIMAQKDGEVQAYSGHGTGPSQGASLVVKATSHVAGRLPPLPQVHDLVARELRLQKAPSAPAELLALYAANKPVFDMTNYQPYLGDLDAAASHLPPAAGQPIAKTASLPTP